MARARGKRRDRPESAEPRPGQESVWDYPRPPRVEASDRHVKVEFQGEIIAQSDRTVRVLETSGAPVYYVPRDDVRMERLEPTDHRTVCEWKGLAHYFNVVSRGEKATNAAFTYPKPTRDYEEIANMISFYPQQVEIYLEGERVGSQPGNFYAGWVTSEIAGPLKGAPGTENW